MAKMTMNKYQQEVERLLNSPPGAETGNISLLCGQLCSEAGEVFGSLTRIKRLAWNGEPREDEWARFDKELGDVFFYLAALCSIRQRTLEEIAVMNIKKLNARQLKGTLTSGSGDDR